MLKKSTLLLTILLVIVFVLGACAKTDAESAVTPSPSAAAVQATPAPEYTISFSQTAMFGCKHAIISAEFAPTDPGITEFGFILSGTSDKLAATIVDGKAYAVLANLAPNTQYIYNVWYMDGGEMKTTEEAYTFTTPARQMDDEALNEYIYAELADQTVTDENRVLLETQACLSLLGMDTDRYGKFGAVTQANLTRVVYTANSLDNFVDYTYISAEADAYALDLLKDILSADVMTNGEDFIRDFVPTPYSLTAYAQLNDEGGSLNIEQYIADTAALDPEITALMAEYPYDVNSEAFKTLYAETIADPTFTEAGRAEKLAGYAAQNKAMFSYKANAWMAEVSLPKERLITLAESENQLTINAFVAYAYMLIDAYRATGDVFVTSTTYRDLDKQWYFYSEEKDRSVAYRHNASWHLERQKYSYVPGFSNHQYGVAIDFYERNSFGDTDLYDYLVAHGNEYGFYNYYIEPWHWVYLGKIF